jgi:hypothetical protein
MIHQLARKCFPAVGSVAGDFRVSGVILLSGALLLAAALFATLANSGMLQLLPVSMLPVFVLWLMGMHRLLWAGTAAQSRGLGAARAALTAAAGFVSLAVVSGLIGFLLGLLHRTSAGP